MATNRRPVRLLSAGDNVVDVYPDLGVLYPGGNAVNVAVHARRQGAQAAYLGVLGSDAHAGVLRAALREEGVDTTAVRVVDGPNAYAVVRLADGDRTFESGHIGVSAFDPSDDDLARMADVDVVHTGECSRLEQWVPELAGAGRLLSFDFSERPWEYVADLAPHVDVAVLSRPGAGHDEAVAAVHRLQDLGPSWVAVTRGADGAVVGRGGDVVTAPAGDGRPVDTIGAGDAFIARLLVGVVRGEPLERLATAATTYASRTCLERGAFGYETPIRDEALASAPDPAHLILEEHR